MEGGWELVRSISIKVLPVKFLYLVYLKWWKIISQEHIVQMGFPEKWLSINVDPDIWAPSIQGFLCLQDTASSVAKGKAKTMKDQM